MPSVKVRIVIVPVSESNRRGSGILDAKNAVKAAIADYDEIFSVLTYNAAKACDNETYKAQFFTVKSGKSQWIQLKTTCHVLHHIKGNPKLWSKTMATHYEKRIDWQGIYHKYRRSTLKKRSILLDQLCDLTGMNRKYLIRKLNKKKNQTIRRRGAKPTYETAIYLPIIKAIWLAADQICGKRMKSVLEDWLPFYEAEFSVLEEAIRIKALQISSATLDRLLKPIKVNFKGRGISGTKPGSILKNQIPIKTNQWEETKSSFMEADTVAHCGTSLEGNSAWSLTMTDILLTWTEIRGVWNKGSYGAGLAIDDVEANLPFEIKGVDCDNVLTLESIVF